MVSESLEPSNWRLIERRSFTSVTKTVTKTTDPIGTIHKLRYHFLEILTLPTLVTKRHIKVLLI